MNETIFIKKIKHENFTTVDNGFVRNTALSWKAKGILLYLISLPENWVLNLNELKNHATDGISSLRAGINELKEKGYVRVSSVKDEKGKFTGTKYEVDEYGMLPELENLISDNPISEKPISENRTLLNTNNNQILNKPNISDTFPEPEEEQPKAKKSSFKKSDYSECVSIITKCQNTLKMKGIQIDETQYPIPILNKWLKQCFTLYGIEDTKKGLINSVTNNWLVSNAHYSISALFSDKVFPKLVSGSSLTNKTRYNFFDDDKVRDYSQDEGKW